MADPKTVRIVREFEIHPLPVDNTQDPITVSPAGTCRAGIDAAVTEAVASDEAVPAVGKQVSGEALEPATGEAHRQAEKADLESQLEALQQQLLARDEALASLKQELAQAQEAYRQQALQQSDALQQQAHLVERLDGWMQESWQQWEPVVAELVAAVLERFLGEGFNKPELMALCIRQAILDVQGDVVTQIHVSPADHDGLSGQLLPLLEAMDSNLAVVADGSVPDGSCFIATEAGDWEVRLESRLQKVARWLQSVGESV